MNGHLTKTTWNFTTNRAGSIRTGLCFLLLLTSLHAAAQPVYTIDSKASRIDILTDSAGMLSRVGHRHVVSARNITGQVELDQASPVARIEFAVTEMVVDDPAARSAAGDGFESQPSEKDIEGTRRNMLGKKLLDAERFPSIRLDVSASSLEAGDTTFDVVIHLRDETVERSIPGTLEVEGERLLAKADFTIDHEELGLKPFSALGGTMRVAPLLEFRVHVEASSNPGAARSASDVAANLTP